MLILFSIQTLRALLQSGIVFISSFDKETFITTGNTDVFTMNAFMTEDYSFRH